ncbi:MAG TPA: hypothetical protein VGJ55_14590 [Pyrinomonadaceae bacterium]|jgi:predicted transcriptional regulator
MSSIREKFGLGYLTENQEPTGQQLEGDPDSADAESLVNTAALAFGGQVLLALKSSKDKNQESLTLNELVDVMNIKRDTLGLIADRLEKLQLVGIEREKYGNHRIRLTEAGENFLKVSLG